MLSSDKKQNAEWSPIKTSLLLQITIFHCPSSHQQLMLQACDLTFVISETKRAVWINVYKPSKRGCSEVRWAVCFDFLCVVFFKKKLFLFCGSRKYMYSVSSRPLPSVHLFCKLSFLITVNFKLIHGCVNTPYKCRFMAKAKDVSIKDCLEYKLDSREEFWRGTLSKLFDSYLFVVTSWD